MTESKQTVEEGTNIDWATVEALAFGCLVLEKKHVRVSGQDVERGTFSQRHAVLHDQENEQQYVPFNSLGSNQARFIICNSSLSEYGTLGVELGYSLVSPDTLTVWEAQFGDSANNARCIIDQYIASGERKWLQRTGLMMTLSHGSDLHSELIVNLTRRQIRRDFRKPLVLLSTLGALAPQTDLYPPAPPAIKLPQLLETNAGSNNNSSTGSPATENASAAGEQQAQVNGQVAAQQKKASDDLWYARQNSMFHVYEEPPTARPRPHTMDMDLLSWMGLDAMDHMNPMGGMSGMGCGMDATATATNGFLVCKAGTVYAYAGERHPFVLYSD
ncbi:KGD1_2 [Sanghuangporus weigelae]